jgi:hypothetical protein
MAVSAQPRSIFTTEHTEVTDEPLFFSVREASVSSVVDQLPMAIIQMNNTESNKQSAGDYP